MERQLIVIEIEGKEKHYLLCHEDDVDDVMASIVEGRENGIDIGDLIDDVCDYFDAEEIDTINFINY